MHHVDVKPGQEAAQRCALTIKALRAKLVRYWAACDVPQSATATAAAAAAAAARVDALQLKSFGALAPDAAGDYVAVVLNECHVAVLAVRNAELDVAALIMNAHGAPLRRLLWSRRATHAPTLFTATNDKYMRVWSFPELQKQ